MLLVCNSNPKWLQTNLVLVRFGKFNFLNFHKSQTLTRTILVWSHFGFEIQTNSKWYFVVGLLSEINTTACYFGTCKILNIQNLSDKAVLKVFHISRELMVKRIKCFQVQCTQVRSHHFCAYFLSSMQNKQHWRVSKM